MNFAPQWLLRQIGLKPTPRRVAVVQAVGVREHLATLNIVAMRQRRIGAWSRVGGDIIDLTLLGVASRGKVKDERRLQGAAALVGGILALDLLCAIGMTRADGSLRPEGSGSHGTGVQDDGPKGPVAVRTAVTIRRPEDEVRRALSEFSWSDFDPAELERSGGLEVRQAPGDRGTEVHLRFQPPVRGGSLGAAALKVAGQAPDQRINDELRQFKSLLETGIVVGSEKTPDGPVSGEQIKQRPAQPVGGAS